MKIIATLLFCILTTSASATANHSTVNVEGGYVTLGHIFPNASEKLKDTQVLIAPQPGSSVVLNHNWLTTIAKKHGVEYLAQTKNDSIKVVGASDMVPIEDVEQALKEHLTQITKSDSFSIKLDNKDLNLHFPKGKAGEILVTNADINSQKTRFSATLVLQHEGRELNRVNVNGRIQPMTMVPVLTRSIHHGETITAADIEWQNLPSSQINQSTIMDETALLGATPKRQELVANKPLAKHDVSIPHMVLRNQPVIIYAESPNISMTAKGKALENGSKDAYVKIMNVDSQRVIHATVIGPQQVRIEIPTMHTILGTE